VKLRNLKKRETTVFGIKKSVREFEVDFIACNGELMSEGVLTSFTLI